MATVRVRDLIRQALQRLMVVASDGSMESVDGENGLEALNNILDQLKTNSLAVYGQNRTEFTITSGVGSYTVATGQDIDLNRPQVCDGIGYYQDSTQNPPLEIPLIPLTDQGYELISFKALTSYLPTNYYYNLDTPTTATVKLWPIPTSALLTGFFYSRFEIAEFADLNVVLSLPPGWRRMLLTNLALELAPVYEIEPTQALIKQASDSMGAVKRSNIRLQVASFDPGAQIGWDSGYITYPRFQSGNF